MHGMEHRVFGAPDASPFRSPTGCFSHPPDQCFQARRSLDFSPQRDQSLVTAFPSPRTIAAFTASIPGSTFPACSFASLLGRLQARSAFHSATGRGSPRSGSFSASARCLSAPSLDRLPPRLPLPFGTFTSLWIKAFRRLGPIGPPSDCARCLSLPVSLIYF
jgi:hypothetical protein